MSLKIRALLGTASHLCDHEQVGGGEGEEAARRRQQEREVERRFLSLSKGRTRRPVGPELSEV